MKRKMSDFEKAKRMCKKINCSNCPQADNNCDAPRNWNIPALKSLVRTYDKKYGKACKRLMIPGDFKYWKLGEPDSERKEGT